MSPVSFLLVDDLEENLLSLEALLRRDGLTLLKARSGDEALELLLRNDVALALVDVQMPGLNGFELAELMRGNERTRRIPIIFVTAGSADSLRRFRGYEAGAVDFIYKPIEPDILRSKAEVFFDLYRQRQQIAVQRDELQAQAEALKDADKRKDEFLATLAHELRNPLAPLRQGIDILRRSPDGAGAADIRDMMDRQLVHLVRLIDDLLDVSRVSQGKIELRKDRIAAADVVRAAVEGSRPLIDAAGHSLTIDMPTSPIWLEADLTRLAQILGNLLNNAAKYTPAGGRIGLSVNADGDTAVIAVTDDGIGIPAEMQSKVFQLFAQVDHHLDRAHGGLGIGLALVKQLVTLHGGTVEVESAGTGQGSTFTVRVPRAAEPERKPDAEVAPPPPSSRSLKILVVDDNVEVAEIAGLMLEEIGHTYQLVHDGRRALETAKAFQPDAILLDIGLPGMDGYAVCRMLRQDDAFKRTPIIAQTGWGQDRDKMQSSAAGFDHHLVKPVTLRDLERLLANLGPH
ncbi:MAG TPA: response regulator [Aliidongia sp.]|uniref:response regulator n=1 Tax=Aliidongia sp. TaxID=1914230 RepID=UPI002DDCA35D|nr:response regulator [Aliidongia sp.]HEV2675379.1 response regulator [Aliidongia sp.]